MRADLAMYQAKGAGRNALRFFDPEIQAMVSARAGFLVAQIDGVRTVEQLIEICGLEELESLEIIDELLRMGAIELT